MEVCVHSFQLLIFIEERSKGRLLDLFPDPLHHSKFCRNSIQFIEFVLGFPSTKSNLVYEGNK